MVILCNFNPHLMTPYQCCIFLESINLFKKLVKWLEPYSGKQAIFLCEEEF